MAPLRGRHEDGVAGSANRPDAPAAFDVVVMGASAGGLSALSVVLAGLPTTFPAAVVLVLHLSPDHRSVLAQVLARSTRLPVMWAVDGAAVRPGTVSVAPPDVHVIVRADRTASLVRSAPVRFARPSIDRLFA